MATFAITNSGELNTEVVLEQLTQTRHPTLGSAIDAWADWARCFAKVIESAEAGEAAGAAGLVSYAQAAEVVIRWRPGVTTQMRVRLRDGRYFQILGMAPIGNRDFLALTCRGWSHQQP